MLFSFGLCVRVCFLNGRWFLRGWWVSVVGVPLQGGVPPVYIPGRGQHMGVCERAECCECLQKRKQLNNQSPFSEITFLAMSCLWGLRGPGSLAKLASSPKQMTVCWRNVEGGWAEVGWAGLRSRRSHLSFSHQCETQEQGIAASGPEVPPSPAAQVMADGAAKGPLVSRGPEPAGASFSTGCVHIASRDVPGLHRWLSGREPASQCRRHRFNPQVGPSPGGGHGNPLQYSYLENPMDRGAWRAMVHGVTQSDMTEAAKHSAAQGLPWWSRLHRPVWGVQV